MSAEQGIPTFKLVLVGDGGTGKVKSTLDAFLCTDYFTRLDIVLMLVIDYIRQATSYW
jgi:GTPase SAR1 family protein